MKSAKSVTGFVRTLGIRNTLFLGVFLIFGLAVIAQFTNPSILNNIRQFASGTNPHRISWQGSDWYLFGVNVPWYNWACDFGCNQNGGASGNTNTLSAGFQKLKDSNVHNVRWWVFPGDPWQITRDEQGMPTGLNPAIYKDFDAALALAEQHDLYYHFVLFSAASHIPKSWLDNPTQRAKLGEVLAPLFARYKDNPRVMTWEIFNEPEFQIWNNEVSESSVIELSKVIANSVHSNSSALVTVGNAMLDGIPMWKDVNLDYYSPHWYDYMESGNWCAMCTTYDEVKTRYGITKPIVIGEYYAGADTNPLDRNNKLYDKGYAGAWAWSLFSDRTDDKLQFDLTAAKTFTSQHSDSGPTALAAPITPVPTTGGITPQPTSAPNAQSVLSLAPSQKTASQGEQFSVKVNLATNGQTINTIQADLTFPSDKLIARSITVDPAFDFVLEKSIGTGTLSIIAASTTPRSGSMTYATVVFEARQSTGTAVVQFASISEVLDSATNSNVLSNTQSASYTIVIPTPTPTNAPTPTPTRVPTATPTPAPTKKGDLNADGKVDIQDLSLFLTYWQNKDRKGDLNNDRKLDVKDVSIIVSNWTE